MHDNLHNFLILDFPSLCMNSHMILKWCLISHISERFKLCELIFLQDPIVRPLQDFDTSSLADLLPEIPLWVKHPDFDRVSISLFFLYIQLFVTLTIFPCE